MVRDWLRQRASKPAARAAAPKPVAPAAKTDTKKSAAGKKLSYKDQRELDQLPARIEALEQEAKAVHTKLADPGLYKSDPAASKQLGARLKEIETTLRDANDRWEVLEAQRSG